MFDDVDIRSVPERLRNCPLCGAVDSLSGFQSKAGPCEMTTVTWAQVSEIHTCCEECGEYVMWRKDENGEVVVEGHPWANDLLQMMSDNSPEDIDE